MSVSCFADHDCPRMQLAVVVTFVLGGKCREPESVCRAGQGSTALMPFVQWRAFLCGAREEMHCARQLLNTILCFCRGFGKRREVRRHCLTSVPAAGKSNTTTATPGNHSAASMITTIRNKAQSTTLRDEIIRVANRVRSDRFSASRRRTSGPRPARTKR